MDVVLLACRGLIATIFLVSAVSKLRSRTASDAFAASLRGMRLLPERAVRPVSTVVAIAEAAVVALLAVPLGAATRAGFGLAAGLLVAFTVVVAVVVRRGLAASCRCFGATAAPLGWRHVVRNAVLAGVALTGLLGGVDLDAPAAEVALGLAIGMAVAVVVVMLDDLVELFAPAPRNTRGGG